MPTPPINHATVQPSPPAGITLAAYAEAKQLPLDHLEKLGIGEVGYFAGPALKIPYLNRDGSEGPVRYRLRLDKGPEGDGRFRWKKGSHPILYGLWKLDAWKKAGVHSLMLVEGESDCHTASPLRRGRDRHPGREHVAP